MTRPTLIMMCGLPGVGKTTRAKALEAQRAALRLCPDEWIAALFGARDHIDDPARADRRRAAVEALQMEMALKVLALGRSVILENGFWGRGEREDYRARARAAGALTELVYLDVPRDVLWSRIAARNKEPGAFVITEKELDAWRDVFEPPTAEELAIS